MRLALLAEAEAELDDAAGWYDDRREGLGVELLQTVRAGLDVILEAPDTWIRWPGAPARIPPIRELGGSSGTFPLRESSPKESRADA